MQGWTAVKTKIYKANMPWTQCHCAQILEWSCQRMWSLPNPSIPVNTTEKTLFNLYLFLFISIYLFLEFMPATHFKEFGTRATKDWETCGKPKNADGNIPQVKRFTGNRWLHHVVCERGFLKRLSALGNSGSRVYHICEGLTWGHSTSQNNALYSKNKTQDSSQLVIII